MQQAAQNYMSASIGTRSVAPRTSTDREWRWKCATSPSRNHSQSASFNPRKVLTALRCVCYDPALLFSAPAPLLQPTTVLQTTCVCSPIVVSSDLSTDRCIHVAQQRAQAKSTQLLYALQVLSFARHTPLPSVSATTLMARVLK